MKNSIATMRALFCLIAAMLLLVGCDEPDKTAAQPQTVRKKITAKAETGPPAATAVAAAPAQPAPAAAAGEKPILAQVAKPQTPPSVPEPPPTQAQPATAAELSPPTGAKPFSLDGNPQPSGIAGVDSLAALLNIQAPPPYNPQGKTDPFEPLLRDESAAAVVAKLRAKADPDRPKTPLEKIDLGQLKLVAIITSMGGNRALVEESSGKGYIIKEGTYIGLNSGKVTGIKADKVLVEEEFEDIHGKSITQKKAITLPKPPGEL
ncbi:MAG: pilus assembly protein PilP [Deltaproteobacteria bacterium]|nr:pilus assembly protein PilP [Deltaproteobacteria bacterium]